MQVTFTNAYSEAIFLSQLYRGLAVGESITATRTREDLDRDPVLKAHVLNGRITLAFTLETTDPVAVGFGTAPLSYTNATRPLPSAVPTFTSIWNTSENCLNWSDGVNWRNAAGQIT